jgi:putative DNA primase/helicase
MVTAIYDYRDANGDLLYQVCRGTTVDGKKKFCQRRPDGNGGWILNLDGVEQVLYRLPELLRADPSVPVYIPEGEKDVDNLIALGLVATCNPGGAGKGRWKPSFSELLRNRTVIVLPDNDETGRAHAERVARSLLGQ